VSEITKAEENILLAVYTFHFLTVEQVTRLLYSKGSQRSGVNPRMKSLVERGYLDRKPLPREAIAGGSWYCYWLATLGRHHLEKKFGNRVTFSNRKFPSQMKLLKSSHMLHALEVTDTLITASQFAHATPAIKIERLLHDFTIHSLYTLTAFPDGFVDFLINNNEQQCLWLEIDRNTEDTREDFKYKKIRRILTCIKSGEYERIFGTPAVTVAFVTRDNKERAEEMKTWTEEVLTEDNMTYEADLFRFGSFPENPDPVAMFSGEAWSVPFFERKHRLVDG
jgi:hypothetical protein